MSAKRGGPAPAVVGSHFVKQVRTQEDRLIRVFPGFIVFSKVHVG